MPGSLRAALISLGIGVFLSACDGSQSAQLRALAFERDTVSVSIGDTVRVRAVGRNAEGVEVDPLAVSYSVSEATAATIDGGLITGKGLGSSVLTARAGQLEATMTIEVLGHPMGVITMHRLDARPFGIAVSRDDRIYVTQLDKGTVTALDTAGAVVQTIAVGQTPTGVAFAPDGQTAYVTNQHSQSVGVINASAGEQVRTILLPANPFVPLVSPGGHWVLITSNTTTVFIADARGDRILGTIDLNGAPNGFALDPRGGRVYISTFTGGTVSEVAFDSRSVLRTFTPGGRPQDLVVSRNGSTLFVANEAGWIDAFDIASGVSRARIPLAGGGFGMALTPDQAYLYVTEPGNGKVEVISTATLEVVKSLDVGGVPRRVAFTHHGGMAVVANEAGYVTMVH